MATIRENKKNGQIVSYRFIVYLGRDAHGKQIKKHCTWIPPESFSNSKARKAAEKAAILWEQELKTTKQKQENNADIDCSHHPSTENQSYDFVTFVNEIWYPTYICNGDRKNTTEAYYQDLSKYITRYFQGFLIQEITPLHIQEYLQNLRQEHESKTHKPLSAKYLNHQYGALRNIFGYAEKMEYITLNPMHKVAAPKIPKKPVDALTIEQISQLLVNLKQQPLEHQVLLTLLLTTGVRKGEALGLKWKDIDNSKSIVYITRGVAYTPQTGIVVSTPKTTSSIRTIPLLEDTLTLLLQLKQKVKEEHPQLEIENGFVFSNRNDLFTPRDPSSIAKIVRKVMHKSGLPPFSAHDLRHTFGTLMIAQGADVKSLQTLLGHSDASVTLNYYVKTDIEQMRKATNKLAAAFNL